MKAKKYYQTPASKVIKFKVQQPLVCSPPSEDSNGGLSRQQRSDWGED